ncbi:hypothetical protein Y032_0049g1810 [Ancylostoma ceylanicum]|uniref:Uncharacterized protein n=1 Tax=Ancylostoma ceylanicum TaxID=53326 RepID=A0A016U955_9BILA|nr:hypothetical protein Y032_0049g1810 [Ancylostoma ceylanicum]
MVLIFSLLVLIFCTLPTPAADTGTRPSLENVFDGCSKIKDKGHRAYLYLLIMKEAGMLANSLVCFKVFGPSLYFMGFVTRV